MDNLSEQDMQNMEDLERMMENLLENDEAEAWVSQQIERQQLADQEPDYCVCCLGQACPDPDAHWLVHHDDFAEPEPEPAARQTKNCELGDKCQNRFACPNNHPGTNNCPKGAQCPNPSCWFNHPLTDGSGGGGGGPAVAAGGAGGAGGADGAGGVASSAQGGSVSASVAGGGAGGGAGAGGGSAVCTSGARCAYKSLSCAFNHPDMPDCEKGASCMTFGCRFNHPAEWVHAGVWDSATLCRFDPKCNNHGCRFNHSGRAECQNPHCQNQGCPNNHPRVRVQRR